MLAIIGCIGGSVLFICFSFLSFDTCRFEDRSKLNGHMLFYMSIQSTFLGDIGSSASESSPCGLNHCTPSAAERGVFARLNNNVCRIPASGLSF